MDINKLETFLTVAKYGSFKAASEHLFLSPRAVSKQMNQIEDELSVRLFERQNNRTSLTPLGKDFTVSAQDIVNSYNNALTKIQTKGEKESSKLKVGISSPSQATIWQVIMNNFLTNHSDIEVRVIQESSPRLLSLIEEGDLDFAITPYYKVKSDIETKDIKKIDLFTGEFFIGISKLNPLSQQKSISLKQLKGQNFLYYTPFGSQFLSKIFVQKFNGLISPHQLKPVSTLEQRSLLVASNKGVEFYPSILIDETELQNPMINFLPISDDCNKFYSSALYYNPLSTNHLLHELVKEVSHNKY